jgi:hypothetical protein
MVFASVIAFFMVAAILVVIVVDICHVEAQS